MDPTTITVIVSIVAFALAAYALWRAHKAGTTITGQLIQGEIATATTTAQEIAAVAKSAVFAAEQLKATGRLPDNNAAFQYALKFSQHMLPDLDAATLTTFIESMVPLANQIYSSLPKAKE